MVAQQKGLSLRVLPTAYSVCSHPGLLRRILANFVANAVRYTLHGGVLIGCRRRGRNLRIEVWDTGIGIPSEARGEIFAGNFRGAPDSSRVAETRGSGLGLASAARAARLLSHPLEVTSIPDRGSRFAVTVPISRIENPLAQDSLFFQCPPGVHSNRSPNASASF